jgi:hypothetical protein
MRAGVVPAALLFVALGLALAFAPRRAWAPSLLVLCASLGAVTWLPPAPAWLDSAFLGCWISVMATAASVHLVRGPSVLTAFALAFNAGVWAAAVVSLSGSRVDLLKALPWLLIVLPASWIVRRYDSVPVKVVSSWLIAIGALAATLQLLPVTPGYVPDHME